MNDIIMFSRFTKRHKILRVIEVKLIESELIQNLYVDLSARCLQFAYLRILESYVRSI